MKQIKIKEALSFGWKTVTNNIWYFIGLTLVVVGVPQLVTMIGAEVGQPLEFVFMLASWLLSLSLNAGLIMIALAFLDNRKPEFSDVFYFGNKLGIYFVASLLFALAAGLGFILLIIPGIIITTMFLFYPYFIFDQNAGITDSLKKSKAATEGVRWDVFLFMLVALGINLLGMIPFGLGLLVTVPLTMLAMAHIYRQLVSQTSPLPVNATVVAPAAPSVTPAPVEPTNVQTPPQTPPSGSHIA